MIRRPPRSTRTTHSFPTLRSSDLCPGTHPRELPERFRAGNGDGLDQPGPRDEDDHRQRPPPRVAQRALCGLERLPARSALEQIAGNLNRPVSRSEEHTSELPSLMRHSYAVFCLKTKT